MSFPDDHALDMFERILLVRNPDDVQRLAKVRRRRVALPDAIANAPSAAVR